jgi:hypothetical protein
MIIKKCSKCECDKDIKAFSRDSRSKDCHTSICKVCKNRQDKEYRRINKAKVSESKRIAYLNNREHYIESSKKRYAENREHILELQKEYYRSNKEFISNRSKKYYEANKGRYNAWAKKYKLRKIQRTPKWLTREDYLKIEAMYELAQRLSIETGILHHVDHIIPLKGETISGLHVPDNLQVIPWYDNLQKSNKFKI